MNRTRVMVGVLVVLIGIAVTVWLTSDGTEVDPSFANAKQAYVCPHCGETFEVTGAESQDMISSQGGIVCKLCGKLIEDHVTAQSSNHAAASSTDEEDDYVEKPLESSGARRRRGG